MVLKALYYPMHRKRLNKASEGGKLYQVLVEKDAEFKPSQYNNFYDSLYTIYNANDPFKWTSIEFHGSRGGIGLYTWLADGVSREFIQSNINSIHQAAEVVEVEEDYANFHERTKGRAYRSASLELDGHYLFNLLQSDGERVGADMVASLCASMQNLDDNEEVGVQFLLRPINYKTSHIASAHFELYKRFGRRPGRLHYPHTKFNPYLEGFRALGGAVRHAFLGSAGGSSVHSSITSIQRKLEAGVYFDLFIRVVVMHPNKDKLTNRLNTVLSSFAPATDKNRLRPYVYPYNKRKPLGELKNYAARRIHTYPLENYVTPPELATMLHFPDKNVPGVKRLRAKKLPVPEGIHQYDTVEDAWKDNAIVFGESNFRGRLKYLAFKDIRMLMQHLYCIGGTGAGKSYFLSFLGLQVIRHAGLTFFDVKGDVIDEFMQYIPTSEWARIVYIDLHDSNYYIPFNILRQPNMSVYNLATMIVATFVKVFSEGSIKEHSQNVLRQALIAVISTDPEGSLLEVYRMFTDEAYLDLTIDRMQKNPEYPDVLTYWRDTFKKMKPSARKSESGAILNKLQTITQQERPRYTLCQKENVLNWRKLMDEKAIILVNLSMGQNEDEILSFFGTLFTNFISKATFSRDDTRRDDRVPHFFILDEFERFVHQESDMSKFLEMARSYGLGLGLAHQSVKQIPEKLLGMIEDNTFSQISLLIGTKSSEKIKKMFPGVTEEDLTSMEEHTGYARFKKLSPSPFTFRSLNMKEWFKPATEAMVKEWKDRYKKLYYKHVKDIKGDIDARYQLVEKNNISDDDSPSVRKGKASGRITREKARL